MKIFKFDLSAAVPHLITNFRVKAGDTLTGQIHFYQGTSRVDAPDAIYQLEVKERGQNSADALLRCVDFSVVDDSGVDVMEFTMPIDSDGLRDVVDAAAPGFVNLHGELTYDDDGTVRSSATFLFRVDDDINKTLNEIPEPVPPSPVLSSVITSYNGTAISGFVGGTLNALLSWLGTQIALKVETNDARFTDERVPTSAGLTSKFSTNKATIIDADKVAIFDSAASDAPKHSLFSLIKSTLKTYFDGLYVALTGNQTIAGNKTFSGTTEAAGINLTEDSTLTGTLTSNTLGAEGLPTFQLGETTSAGSFLATNSGGFQYYDTSAFPTIRTGSLVSPALTGNRTWTFKDASGTVAFTSDITGTNSGVNTGDQTSIVGITGTLAQFNTALTDGDFASLAGTETLSNKRLPVRVTSITSSATPTVNSDNCDMVTITALAAAVTSMTSGLTGTPSNGDMLLYRIKDNGTARAITWGASFVQLGSALPTTTVLSKTLHALFIWDSVTSKWACISTSQEF